MLRDCRDWTERMPNGSLAIVSVQAAGTNPAPPFSLILLERQLMHTFSAEMGGRF